MSRKVSCWDNSPMESFLKTLKVEWVNRFRYARAGTPRFLIDWIAGFYNAQRLHSSIDYRSRTVRETALRGLSLLYVKSMQGHFPQRRA